MSDADLDAVAAALGRPLPTEYRRFVRTCPKAEFHRHFPKFYSRPRDLIRFNRGMLRLADERVVREPDGAGGWTPLRPWPVDWLVVGDNDGDYFWFVRPDADGPGLWTWEHDGATVRRVADSLDAALAAGQAERGTAPVPEPQPHPTLGDLLWNPERRWWDGKYPVPGGQIGLWLRAGDSDPAAFLEAAANLVPALVATEASTFGAAMTAGAWADLVSIADDDLDTLAGRTAETVRELLGWQTLVVANKPGGLTIEYHYRPAPPLEPLGQELLMVDTDPGGRVRGWHWLS